MSTETLQLLAALAGIFGSSGAAWVGVKVSLNGTRARVLEIHQDVKDLRGDVGGLSNRVTRIEAKMEDPH